MGLMADHAPAPLKAVVAGSDGTLHEIDNDVMDICRRLQEIDPTLYVRLNKNPVEPYYVVYCRPNEQDTYLVTTTTELDARVVDRIREISDDGYDFVAERDAMRRYAMKEKQYQTRQKLLEAGERLHWRVQKELGVKPRAFVPRDVDG
jgi:hypothetical protein